MTRRAFGSRWNQGFGAFGTPFLYAAAAFLAGVLVPRLEARFFPGLAAAVSVNAAIAVLSAIASGMLPLTGLVFSLAFVMVQFCATAYSPGMVSWLAGSAMMRHSLGVFTAAFIYALAALIWIDRGGSGKVPLLTVSLAIALLMASIVVFMLLVDTLGMLQIARVLPFVGDQGRVVIERDYAPFGDPAGDSAGASADLPPVTQVVVHRGGPAVIQQFELRRLAALAARENVVLSSACAVGDTLVDGMPLLRVHGGGRPLSEASLRPLVRLGVERTFEQDPKYAIRLLVDIAIRALSPAVNDPTTAVQALDQVEDLLLRLSRRDLSVGRGIDASGTLRLVFPVPSWEDFLVLAFDEIRYCGANSIQVMRRMRALIQDLIDHVPSERTPALRRYLERVDNGIRRTFDDLDDRSDAFVEDRQGLGLSQERGQG